MLGSGVAFRKEGEEEGGGGERRENKRASEKKQHIHTLLSNQSSCEGGLRTLVPSGMSMSVSMGESASSVDDYDICACKD